MKIAYIGNTRVPFTTESHIGATLQSMGHSVTHFQEDEVNFDEVAEEALGYDFLMWQRTWSLDAAAQMRMLAKLEAAGVPTVAIHLDRYWGLKRERQIFEEPWWRAKYVFSADGGNQKRFQVAGVNHHWLRPAIFEPECVLGRARAEYVSDVAFVGSSTTYHPEWPWRRELLRGLRRRYARRFALWPKGDRAIRGADLSDLFASVKVVVGDSCFAGACESYWSDRPYETVGRGGFLIFPRVSGLENDFTDGTHLRFFEAGDLVGLIRLIDECLEDESGREQLRLAGFEHVKANHTYRHRMTEMLAVLAANESSLRGEDPRILKEVFDENVYRFDPDQLPANPVVVDIGANVGMFSRLALRSGARVVAVEPFVENLEALRRNLNGQALIVEAAIGCSGTVEVVPGSGGGRSSGAWTRPGKGVRSMTIAELLRETHLEQVDFLKVDCEGCEYDAFTDAPLERIGRIVIEFHTDPLTSQPKGDLGALILRLAEYGHVETLGRPSTGGYLYWRRNGL